MTKQAKEIIKPSISAKLLSKAYKEIQNLIGFVDLRAVRIAFPDYKEFKVSDFYRDYKDKPLFAWLEEIPESNWESFLKVLSNRAKGLDKDWNVAIKYFNLKAESQEFAIAAMVATEEDFISVYGDTVGGDHWWSISKRASDTSVSFAFNFFVDSQCNAGNIEYCKLLRIWEDREPALTLI